MFDITNTNGWNHAHVFFIVILLHTGAGDSSMDGQKQLFGFAFLIFILKPLHTCGSTTA